MDERLDSPVNGEEGTHSLAEAFGRLDGERFSDYRRRLFAGRDQTRTNPCMTPVMPGSA